MQSFQITNNSNFQNSWRPVLHFHLFQRCPWAWASLKFSVVIMQTSYPGILPHPPRQMRDNVVLRNGKWRKSFSCIPLYNSLFYKKFYCDKKSSNIEGRNKSKNNKKILLFMYLCICCSLSICVLVSPIHPFIENVMDPIYLHISFSGTVVEKQVWCEDFIFLGWEVGIIIKQKELKFISTIHVA